MRALDHQPTHPAHPETERDFLSKKLESASLWEGSRNLSVQAVAIPVTAGGFVALGQAV